MSTPRGVYSRWRRIESVRRVQTPINLHGDSGPAAESGPQYQPRESLYDRPRHLDDGNSDCGEGNPESGAPHASLSETPLSPCTPLSSSTLHNRRQSESYSSEIVGMLQQQQLLHKVLAEQEEIKRRTRCYASSCFILRRKCVPRAPVHPAHLLLKGNANIIHDLTVLLLNMPSVLL